MVDIFELFETLEKEEYEAMVRAQQAKETTDNKSAEYSPEPEEVKPQASPESALTNNSQTLTKNPQSEVINNELQPESVQTD